MTENRPALISVIIPCYNGEQYLRESIDSVLTQSYPNIEVVVVNDGSTDGSVDIMNSYGDSIRVVDQINTGLPAARNAGIKQAHGEFFAFLDADDYWHKEFLLVSLTILEENKAGISYSGWQNIGLSGGRGEPFIPPDYELDPEKNVKLIEGVRWPVHAALVRRSVVEQVGGFDPLMESCEDFAFWIRAATTNKLARVPKVLAFYRHHGRQMISNRIKIVSYHLKVQQEFVDEFPEIIDRLGRDRILQLIWDGLLHKGYEAYWRRDFETARMAFRRVLRTGYFGGKDIKYLLPALLPLNLHKKLVELFDNE